MSREALLITHTGRKDATGHAITVARDLKAAGFGVRVLADEAPDLAVSGLTPVAAEEAADGVDIVFALGGDGTFLRAAELARPVGAPLLGINLGRVGFLAEAEMHDLDSAVRQVARGEYTVEERLTVDVTVYRDGEVAARSWALNEAVVEKGTRERMLEVLVEVDGRPLSRYGCDGVVCATPTGSTAYAFSAGGPVVWPTVEALLLVPVSAHALFSKPLVTGPDSILAINVEPYASFAMLNCDGRRIFELDPGSRVVVRRGEQPVRVVRLLPQPFTDRLVKKFALPVDGWRGAPR